ncbi:tetratricopeptide repeat family protein [Formosa agariphila KMM 3901]|uniref:Tetratricopeptide repeat family protein n=1 Tax=Formosa agariphila (strain DSM 15362 / KCTC 12365 / LMG 23005 / KMM 3901 / M-2Alg 35-1) TaxID=1347342 RepID=T2KR17_FORAG|nr:multiheme c-type cytochrome [Formosa agariphila]CDF80958.1 tetratricopeptide repeat family protein [Formosa agariphila KMM 3901]
MKHVFWVVCLVVLSACNSKTKQSDYVAIEDLKLQHKDGFIGDSQCMECHKGVYDDWRGSDHDLAMQVANDSTILGDFNNVKTIIDGVSYHFTRSEDDKFMVHVKEIDGSEVDYEISYAFGVRPLQQYLIDFDRGRKQVLRVTWDTEKGVWFHQYKGDEIDPHDWLHWTETAQNWNTMCAECHSTNLEKDYNVETDSYDTKYSIINVSCESCHGPAERHVYWANNIQDSTHTENTYIIPGNSQFSQMNMCAPCHARRARLTEKMIPGTHFEDQYLLQNITNDLYHGDGQIEDEDYVYGSFLQSKMYHEGVTCSDCHDPHTLKTKYTDNRLCLQCHTPNYNEPSHHFHEAETDGAQCVNCHMTGAVYMGNDFRRDHSFRVPRPDQSVEYGTPNACTQCHQDKSDEWAAKQVVEWYGPDRLDHYSDQLLISNKSNISVQERMGLDTFINNLDYPAIARATVIENIDITNNEQFEVILKSLEDPSPMVRFNALQKFRNISPQDRVFIASKHLSDTTRLVRIGAMQLLTGIDAQTLATINQSELSKARHELETMMFTNADFSTGRLQLGDYYLQNNDPDNAIKNYELALKKDSLLLPVYSNLATAYSLKGNSELALSTLNTWLRKEPNAGRAYYLRALLNFEIKANEQAVSDLNQAIKIDSTDTRSMYNLATFYYQNKKFTEAEHVILKAVKLLPDNQDYQYLLALIYQGQGKTEQSNRIMQNLQNNQNNS